MFSGQSRVAAMENPAHNFMLPHHSRDHRRHSTAPFSLSTASPDADTKYRTLDSHHRSRTLSTHESYLCTTDGIPNDRTFLFRMGQKLSTLLGAPIETHESTALVIGIRKEIQIVMEEDAEEMGGYKKASPLPHKSLYFRTRPGREAVYKTPVGNSPAASSPSTSSSSGQGEIRIRRKPAPLSLTGTRYRANIQIERTDLELEHPGLPTLTRLPDVSASNEVYMNRGAFSSSSAPLRAAYSAPEKAPPIPPRSPKRLQHHSPIQLSTSSNTKSGIVAPVGLHPAQSLITAWKGLFGGGGSRWRKAYGKKGVPIARKTSLKRNRNKAAAGPVKVLYQPHSARVAAAHHLSKGPTDSTTPLGTPTGSGSHRFVRKRRPSLPSFLPIDSR